jgi:hypothetical protein
MQQQAQQPKPQQVAAQKPAAPSIPDIVSSSIGGGPAGGENQGGLVALVATVAAVATTAITAITSITAIAATGKK